MIKKVRGSKVSDVYEHLDHYLKNTTPADRLQWLKDANAFVQKVERLRKEGKLFIKKSKKG